MSVWPQDPPGTMDSLCHMQIFTTDMHHTLNCVTCPKCGKPYYVALDTRRKEDDEE